ncbi:hypothetical protein AU381_09065 [Sinorhizobium glycinis]|uniref:Uncharacterized protein n=2 Tax=Sinorhizobium TaxID=28105 RepID=I3XGL2_SINF2|nr:hypothetical protein USDA257_p03030 [Sinorhizobium fredii USDA 257]OAP43772.1 hypothetical protein AU381_09065 [Sinorhizobium glycinis]UTY47746.1 hypothetical protein EPK84_13685 [Sinorhizobium fredii]CCE98768.1 hypothetical protein SFHH103_04286 [Sinorhizobium fredii HH103]CEO91563.1 hypothetical protein SFHH103_psfHH103d_362 [Sinorhizobium fredii HH103]
MEQKPPFLILKAVSGRSPIPAQGFNIILGQERGTRRSPRIELLQRVGYRQAWAIFEAANTVAGIAEA